MKRKIRPAKGQMVLYTLDLLGWKKVGKFGKGTIFSKGKKKRVVGKYGFSFNLA